MNVRGGALRPRGTRALLLRSTLAVLFAGGAMGAAPHIVSKPPKGAKAMKAQALVLTSTAFSSGGGIPTRHTCEGSDVPPALAWSDAPPGTRTFALIVDDPDAPDPAAPKMTWVHWVLYDLPAAVTGLPEGVAPDSLPHGTRQGRNDWKREGWGGPCPPIGRHRYFFKLYALDKALGALKAPNKAGVEQAMKGHVLAQGTLVGTYEKGH